MRFPSKCLPFTALYYFSSWEFEASSYNKYHCIGLAHLFSQDLTFLLNSDHLLLKKVFYSPSTIPGTVLGSYSL